MKNPFALFGQQWIAKTATLVVVAAGAVTVAVTNVPAPSDHTLPHLPVKNVASWTMPLDRYLPVNTHKQDYATDLLLGKCLATKGFDWGVPWQGEQSFASDGVPGLDIDGPLGVVAPIARGYHAPAEDSLSDYLWMRFVTQAPLSKAHQALWDSCFRGLRRTYPEVVKQNNAADAASSTAVGLANDAYSNATRDATVEAAAGRWRSCLAPAYAAAVTAGVKLPTGTKPTDVRWARLTVSPSDLPTSEMQQMFSTNIGTSPVSSGEVALAKQDLACQQSSGYRSALYAAEYRLQSRVSAPDAAVFAKTTLDQRAYNRELDGLIAQNLPAKPRLP